MYITNVREISLETLGGDQWRDHGTVVLCLSHKQGGLGDVQTLSRNLEHRWWVHFGGGKRGRVSYFSFGHIEFVLPGLMSTSWKWNTVVTQAELWRNRFVSPQHGGSSCSGHLDPFPKESDAEKKGTRDRVYVGLSVWDYDIQLSFQNDKRTCLGIPSNVILNKTRFSEQHCRFFNLF